MTPRRRRARVGIRAMAAALVSSAVARAGPRRPECRPASGCARRDDEAACASTELSRRVDGRRTAVTYVNHHGQWQGIDDQGTVLEFDAGTTSS
jgi:hypothetical protein